MSITTELPTFKIQAHADIPEREAPEGQPLTIGEARLVAEDIRTAPQRSGINRDYWPWVINGLCNMIEELEAREAGLTLVRSKRGPGRPRKVVEQSEDKQE